MKNIIRLLLAGVILPTAAVSFLQTSNSINKPIDLTKINRPYVVDVIDTHGSVVAETAGVSTSSDPYTIADELGSKPFVEDKFATFPDMKMGIGSKITLYRAPTFTIFDGKKKTEVRSWTDTVGELLSEANVLELGDDDKINFSTTTVLEDQMEIRIIRVAITTVRETEPIAYKTIKKDDKTLDQGKTRVEKKGEAGQKTLSYTVRREDGVQISKVLSGTEITKQPVDEILIIGTKPVITVRCRFNDTVLEASIKYGVNPNGICTLMMKESQGNNTSVNTKCTKVGNDWVSCNGLFQYTDGFWSSSSSKAGYSGASIWNAEAQIFTTAWAWSHGLRSRWP